MKQTYAWPLRGLLARVAVLLTSWRPLAGCGAALLLTLLLATPAARAQAPTVTVTPAGPLTLCAGSTQTLTATATVPGFNVAGTGFDGGVSAVAVQADGKVLVGGGFTSYNGDANAPDCLLRLNADGSLDNTFNNGPAAGANGNVFALAVQADGKVLVGGYFDSYNGNAAAPDDLLRLNADGSLDNTFNAGGAGADNTVNALAVQADGKVLVGGVFTSYNGNMAAPDYLLRLNADGSLDNTFNNGGSGVNNIVNALAVQADGKVLVGGQFTSYNGNAAAPDDVLRLNADGSLDNAFNNGGSGANSDVLALAVQADGKVLVGGFFTSYNGNAAAPDQVLRLNANGSLDNAFNAGGAGANGFVNALAVQADGKVLIGGFFTSYNGNAAAPDYVLRLNAGGSLDAGFNAGGAGADNTVFAVAVQADGKVLVGGFFTSYNGNAAAPDYLVRLNADGSLNDGTLAGLAYTWSNGATGPSITVSQPGDYQAKATTTSNGTGYSNVVRVNAPPAVTVQVTPAGPLALTGGSSATLTATATVAGFNVAGSGFNGDVFAVAIQADGKVLVGGGFTSYNGNAAAPDNVLRLNADGSLDNTFNNGGAGAISFTYSYVNALAVQADGKVLVGGSFTAYNGNAAAPDYVLRLNADGSLDTGFNNGGAGADDAVQALAVQADGKVLVGGYFTAYNGNAAAPDYVLRLNADGSLDTGFNNGRGGADAAVQALAVQADGKVLVGGSFTAYNGNAAAPDYVLRLNADGSLDTSFNNGGAGADNTVTAVAVQADGKVLVGGHFAAYNYAAAPDNVLRLNADGSLDTGFNNGRGGADNAVYALAVQADGKVLVGGHFVAYNNYAAAPNNVLRLNADGSLDTGFNNGANAGANDAVYALAVQADGKVLVGGYLTAYNGNAAAPDYLVRLNANGSLNNAATALPGATFVFNPGNTTGATRTVRTAGTYTATATDPATGCTYTSNAVVVTTPAPTLATLSPSSGLAGSTLAATGTNLQGASAITFTSSTGPATAAPAGYVVASDGTGISGIGVPAGLAPGAYTVTVTTPNGTSNGRTYTVVVPAPAISSFAPTSGAAGTPVTLTGTNLSGATAVTVNGVAVVPTNVTSTTLSFVVPAGASATQAITVTTPGGTSPASTAFTVQLLAAQAGTSPTPNTVGAPVASSALAVGFSEPVSAASAASLAVFSAQAGGLKAGTVTTSGNTASYISTLPAALRDFRAGETVNVTVPASVLGAGGLAATPYVYQFTTATVASPGIFAPPVSYPTGNRPENVAVADFNGDGILDLVTASNVTGVSVLLGDGTDSFGTPTNYALSGYPAGVAAGDVNGDGRLDIVVANLSSSSVQVLLGQADGSFAAAVDYPNSNAVALALGDFNGDGRLDIVTADFGPSVSVLLGQAGGFGATTKYAVSGQIRGVAVGDVNSDGRLDIVAANSNASNVTVLLGNGTGGFGTPTNYPAGSKPYSVALGDVNNDGRPDLVTANSGTASVSVLLGQATGGFAAPVDYATSVTTAGLALGDVNGDGRLDIAVAEFGNGSVSDGNGVAVLLGQAGGTFAARVDYAAGLLARGLVLGDVNNDGRLDILTANQSANTTAVLLNLASAPLPVELTAFTATAGASGTVRLAWTTAAEKNSKSFEVERSADGVTFSQIGALAAAGTSLTPRAYALLDAKLPTGATVLYYRLRQIDLDGTAHYSAVRTVALTGASAGLSLYPNPAHGGTATLLGAQPGTVVAVLDALGRTVATAPADASGTATLVLPQGLAAGVYVVRAGQQALRLTVE